MCGTQETEACRFISELVYARCRIRLDATKRPLISSRLGKRLRQLGLNSLAEYCHLLRTVPSEEELTYLVNTLSTNFTQFMREPDHFHFLIDQALPTVLGPGRRFRVWSAACATGEEPYTMAFFLSERYPPSAGWDWQILATDVSTKALETAVAGIYPEAGLAELPREWHRAYFQQGQGHWQGHYRVKPAVRERIVFRPLNLLSDHRFTETFAVIFCRNVMIYFDRPTQAQLIKHLGRWLGPQGFLLIGHAESLHGLNVPFRCLRPSVYQKI